MISPNVITEISRKEEISWSVVEKDYFLTLLLEGIANNSFLRKNFVFKGGTALRKICFKHYRYSEDLDFTAIKKLNVKEIEKKLNEVLDYLKKEHNADFRIKEIYGREWFQDIKIQFIGLKGIKNTITIDVMSDEVIVDEIKERKIFNKYYSNKIIIQAYSLEEILAEKLRSVLQRTRVRDYYDIWYILHHAKSKIDINKLKKIFAEKLKYKNIKIENKKDLLTKEKIEQAKAYYQRQIAHQIKNPPLFNKLIKELESFIEDLPIL